MSTRRKRPSQHRTDQHLDAPLTASLQRGHAAGLAAPPSPEEQASFDALYTQFFGTPEDGLRFYPSRVAIRLYLHAMPLWEIYRQIGMALEPGAPDLRANMAHLYAEVPTESTLTRMTAILIEIMLDVLSLTDGWDTMARRSATLAQVGLPPRGLSAEPEAPQGTA